MYLSLSLYKSILRNNKDSAVHSPGMIKKGGIDWRQACAEQPKAIILPSIIGSNYFTCAIFNISI